MNIRISARLFCSILLMTTTLVFGSQATYLSAKAILAQALLASAWEKSMASGRPVKPWAWADIYPVALLEVPRLGVRQVVLEGHSGEAMAFGPGLVSLDDSHVLGGHRDSHFEFVRRMEAGDTLSLTAQDGMVTDYVVAETRVMDSRLMPDYTPPGNSLTLITCFPFDALTAGGPLRYVVVAVRKFGWKMGPGKLGWNLGWNLGSE